MKTVHTACAALLVLLPGTAAAQAWDPGERLSRLVGEESGGKLEVSGQIRGRYRRRAGTNFSAAPDPFAAWFRTRLSLTYKPVAWLKLSGMIQDARAQSYYPGTESSARDPADLMEAYIEVVPENGNRVGLSAGRRMLVYGESHLVGSSQWSNTGRPFDHARVYVQTPRMRLEALFVSPVNILPGGFNRPRLGNRVWGTYDSFPAFWRKHLLEAYFLRHEETRDRLGINSFGFRMAGNWAGSGKYSIEGVKQNGKVGDARHRASAWYTGISYEWTVKGRALSAGGAYNYASGTRDPSNPQVSGTFDAVYSAAHDRFGHQDLFGWRNMHNMRGVAGYAIRKGLIVNLMYVNTWLASARDAVYNGSGRPIARCEDGSAGRHVGQEADVFATYEYGHFLFGAGYGYFFPGAFVRTTTPGKSPAYVYLFHTYSF